jgi:hypothetical protein
LISGPAAIAALVISVQGVVVQTSSLSPGSTGASVSRIGSFTNTDGSVTSW